MISGIAQFARHYARQSFLAAKYASVRGAYLVEIIDGQIIIHAKTRVPRVER